MPRLRELGEDRRHALQILAAVAHVDADGEARMHAWLPPAIPRATNAGISAAGRLSTQ